MIAEHGKQSEILAEYVLGLLPETTRAEVESHLAECARCREAVARERGLVAEVRQTLAEAGQADAGRLKASMPDPPARHGPFPALDRQRLRPVAALTILLLLFLGVMQRELYLWQPGDNAILSSPSATTLVATATTTPTATKAGRAEPGVNKRPRNRWAPATLVISPPPSGTRLVALPAGTGRQ